ncbi:MAG TPA: class I SAM-dependent methyltransferase [Chitinophagaceae bacterium]|jgi:SAM-dependent methyltransferase
MLQQSPFDILAETYDSDFTESSIGRLQRKRVWKILTPLLRSCNRSLKILEINCGTGEDALHFAEKGHRVIATDESGEMIGKAQQKLYRSKINSPQIKFIRCSFSDVTDHFKNEKFDLVFSNFGGINCIDENMVKQLSKDISSITASDSHLFLTVMGRSCLWEMLYYTFKGKFSTAFRRQKRSVLFQVNGSSIPVFYYSPRSIKRLFQPEFKPVQTYPVGLFIPPSYLEKQFFNRRHWLDRLNHWEEIWGNSMFSSLADHFCIVLKRNGQE